MEPEKNTTPASSQKTDETLASSAVNKNSELYHQIAREDSPGETVLPKKRKSPFMMLMVAIMRFTLYIDSVRRTHEPLFHLLGFLWGLWVAFLYICGILVLVLSIYNRLRLPLYLEEQLQARDIQFESADYGMDRIEVHNLKGPNNSYTVDTLVVNTTFTDLLQKRIRSVIVDGLKIQLDANPNFNPIQDIPALLSHIQNPVRGNMNLKIDALEVSNARLRLVNQQMDLPITFSVQGIYNDQAKVMIPLMITKPSLSARGALMISGETKNPEWTLSITEGKVTLPRHPPEDFSGELKVILSDNTLNTVQANFKIGSGTIEKTITASFKKKNDGLAGQLVWNKNNKTESAHSSNLSVDVAYLSLFGKQALTTRGELVIKSQQFDAPDFGFKSLNAPLEAEITCPDWQKCSLSVVAPSKVSIQSAWINYQRQKFQTKKPLQFNVQPQNNAVSFQTVVDGQDFVTSFLLPLQDVVFESANVESGAGLSLNASDLELKGRFADQVQLAVASQKMSYKATTLAFNNASLNIGDIFQETSPVSLNGRDVTVAGMPLLSHPFNLVFNKVGEKSTAHLTFKGQPIDLKLDGQLSVDKKTFVGQIDLRPFDLSKLTISPQELWPNLPTSISRLSGQMAVRGQLQWAGGQNIKGPLYLGLKDVSFYVDKTPVSGVNTVLTMDALSPFMTREKQHVFVKNIDSLIPFNSVDVVFQVDSQNFKLMQLAVVGGGLPLMASQSVFSLQNNVLISLKNNRSFDAPIINQAVNLENIRLSSGLASVSVPVELRDGLISVPNVTVRVQDAVAQWPADTYKDVFDKASGYFVRNGQIIMNQDKQLQMSLTGRVLPSKAQQDVQLNKIPLPNSFFKAVPAKAVPPDIQSRLDALFGAGS